MLFRSCQLVGGQLEGTDGSMRADECTLVAADALGSIPPVSYTHLSFTCVHGLYDYGNVSSAHDLALIAKACAENETYMQVANTLSYTLPATNLHQNERAITSTTLMLNPEYAYYRDYIRGMKTGFTTLAEMCIRDRFRTCTDQIPPPADLCRGRKL